MQGKFKHIIHNSKKQYTTQTSVARGSCEGYWTKSGGL